MSATVFHVERAAGVHPSLIGLLSDWERDGTHDVLVAGGAPWPNGGFESGLSKARSLLDTPHGRGAALDIWPAGFIPSRSMGDQPQMLALFTAFGDFAVAHGFHWGGHWITFKDLPHVELPNWRSLPYPPQAP